MTPATMLPRTLKERQRQEREALILLAAEEVLIEKGYHEMSMDEIAARVGISKGTVYLHFASKEDLVFEGCMREMMEQLTTCVTSLLEEGKASGEFDATLATSVMLSAFFSLLSPKSYERLIGDDQLPPGELVKQLGRIYFKGIAAN